MFDLPNVVKACGGRGMGGRLTREGGDFFDRVPEGADLYILKFILHDWDDERSVKILRNVRAAMAEGARVAVIEAVLPPTPVPHPAWLMDLNMLAITEGRERTAAEYGALFEAAGLVLQRVVDTASPLSVLIAAARPE
ncbi:MAG: methyltransferase [Caulobacterales bacterium]